VAIEKIELPSTAYSPLSDSELYAMYRPSCWNGLAEAERKDLLQETVNREAITDGCKFSASVSFEDLPASIDGYQSEGNIVLNYNKTVLDIQTAEIDGETVTAKLSSPSYDSLCTVLHEYRHIKQDAIINGVTEAEQPLKASLEANSNVFSVVDGKIGSQYMTGETDYGLYYLQPCELDAYVFSEERTDAVMKNIEAEYGTDPAMEAYREKMSTQGHEAQLKELRAQYNNPNAEHEVAKVLQNTYENIAVPTDPNIEAAVKGEMIASANAIFEENSASLSQTAENGATSETAELAAGFLSATGSGSEPFFFAGEDNGCHTDTGANEGVTESNYASIGI